jgi:hypothetical protein
MVDVLNITINLQETPHENQRQNQIRLVRLHFSDGAATDDERALILPSVLPMRPGKLQTRVLLAARHEKFDREIMNEAGAKWAFGLHD